MSGPVIAGQKMQFAVYYQIALQAGNLHWIQKVAEAWDVTSTLSMRGTKTKWLCYKRFSLFLELKQIACLVHDDACHFEKFVLAIALYSSVPACVQCILQCPRCVSCDFVRLFGYLLPDTFLETRSRTSNQLLGLSLA